MYFFETTTIGCYVTGLFSHHRLLPVSPYRPDAIPVGPSTGAKALKEMKPLLNKPDMYTEITVHRQAHTTNTTASPWSETGCFRPFIVQHCKALQNRTQNLGVNARSYRYRVRPARVRNHAVFDFWTPRRVRNSLATNQQRHCYSCIFIITVRHGRRIAHRSS